MDNTIKKEEKSTTKTKKRVYFTDQEWLQKFGIVFENLKTQDEIKTELSEYGYTDIEISKGKELFDKALSEYQKNVKETQEENTTHHLFNQKLEEVMAMYAIDRKKARIVFKDQNDVLINLRLKGRSSQAISAILDDVRVFYTTLQQNSSLVTTLNRMKIDDSHIANQIQKISDTEKAYAQYTKKKGESQQATKNKTQALKAVEKWVKEFYAIAKIALSDKPQLLESIGKHIKS